MIPSVFCFGEYSLDSAKRELLRDGQRVSVPARAFDCLAYLAAHRDRAVGRDELIAAVWGKVDVSNNVLDQCVLQARRAVGDIGEERRIIRTVHGFGYAWVALTSDPEPSTIAAPSAAPTSSTPALPATPSPRPRSIVRLTTAIVAAVIVAAAVWFGGHAYFANRMGVRAPRAPSTMLVLPVDVKATSQHAWVRLGVMDLIAERLRSAGQTVVPSDVVVALAEGPDRDASSDVRIDRIAKAARATWLIAPRAELIDARWRVTLRLVRGAESPLSVEGESIDAIGAARLAADRLALALGLSLPPAGTDDALTELLQRAEAARLANRLDDARAILDGANAQQRADSEVIYLKARIDIDGGRFDAAGAAFLQLLERPLESGDPLLRARTLYGLGFVAFRRRDDAAAIGYFDNALLQLGSVISPEKASLAGRILSWRGNIHFFQNDRAAAKADYARARIVLETSGDRMAMALLDSNEGIAEMEHGRFAEALPMLERAATAGAAFHDPRLELNARLNIAKAQWLDLNIAAALAEEPHLRALREGVADPLFRQFIDLTRATVLVAAGRSEAGDALLVDVTGARDKVAESHHTGWALAAIAQREFDAGRIDQALATMQRSLAIDWHGEDPRQFATARLTLLRLQLAKRDIQAAVANIDALEKLAVESGVAPHRIYADVAHAELAAAQSRDADARQAFDAALTRADAERVPLDLVRVCDAYARFLIDEGDLSAASAVAGRVAQWADRDYEAALLQLRLLHALGEIPAWRSALARTARLAGERAIPTALAAPPVDTAAH